MLQQKLTSYKFFFIITKIKKRIRYAIDERFEVFQRKKSKTRLCTRERENEIERTREKETKRERQTETKRARARGRAGTRVCESERVRV